MAYAPFNQALPDGTANGAATLEDIRENQAALRDMILTGMAPGWGFAPTGGTSSQPASIVYTKGVEIVRMNLTWGSSGGADGNVTQIVSQYSSNSGSSYDDIGTFIISYNADGSVNNGAWS